MSRFLLHTGILHNGVNHDPTKYFTLNLNGTYYFVSRSVIENS